MLTDQKKLIISSIEKVESNQCFVSNYNDQNIELLGEIEIEILER